jgi:hypothetical protein
MALLPEWAQQALGNLDVTDRAARALGLVGPAAGAVWDVSDRAARLLGVADVSDRAARLLGVADVSDRSARQLGAVTKPQEWAQEFTPAAGVRATSTKAAGGAGVRHVCTAIVVSLATNAATAVLNDWVLRDGASTIGAPLFGGIIGVPATADESRTVAVTGLAIVGSLNTAMTLELDAAPPASGIQRVALAGYSV